jgi:hypothetical protein
MNSVKRQRVIATVSWLLVAIPTLYAEQPKPTAYQVQAAYLYNFGKFAQWPVATRAKAETFNVCVFGEDPFGPILNATVAGGTVDGKTVVAKRIVSAPDAVECRILFISLSEDKRLDKILEALNGAAVLTVSDMPRFAERGGMIQFILDENRVRFQVNLTAAQNAGLILSSQLLKLAALVRRSSSPGE